MMCRFTAVQMISYNTVVCISLKSLTVEKNGERVSCALSIEAVDIGKQLLQLSFTLGVEVIL